MPEEKMLRLHISQATKILHFHNIFVFKDDYRSLIRINLRSRRIFNYRLFILAFLAILLSRFRSNPDTISIKFVKKRCPKTRTVHKWSRGHRARRPAQFTYDLPSGCSPPHKKEQQRAHRCSPQLLASLERKKCPRKNAGKWSLFYHTHNNKLLG